jgi:predicted TIM-barrel fold metal-dependent hydrolase
MPRRLDRRRFLAASLRASTRLLGASALAAPFASLTLGCSPSDPERYTEQDAAALDTQREDERMRSGSGPFGPHRYRGYRGLAELPYFELDADGRLRLVDDSVPPAIDLHAHLGISVLFEPELDLQAPTDRVRHLLDCDATNPGCELDLDVYVNANFDEAALRTLQWTTVTQGLWGNDFIRSHTIPNLLAEMDAMRVERSVILPIVMGFPFGDDLAARWKTEIDRAGVADRLLAGASVHPRDPDKIAQLEAAAASGARVLKLHPTVQAFYPDDEDLMEVYQAADRLGLVVFFHGGRAGIEPESRHRYALPRHYEAAFASFPGLPFVVGHAGARDGEAMLELGLRYDNVWFGIHGQGITHLDRMIGRTRGERLLFGTDWPFYHLATSLAKVLIVTDTPARAEIRHSILRGNAEHLLA